MDLLVILIFVLHSHEIDVKIWKNTEAYARNRFFVVWFLFFVHFSELCGFFSLIRFISLSIESENAARGNKIIPILWRKGKIHTVTDVIMFIHFKKFKKPEYCMVLLRFWREKCWVICWTCEWHQLFGRNVILCDFHI